MWRERRPTGGAGVAALSMMVAPPSVTSVAGGATRLETLGQLITALGLAASSMCVAVEAGTSGCGACSASYLSMQSDHPPRSISSLHVKLGEQPRLRHCGCQRGGDGHGSWSP